MTGGLRVPFITRWSDERDVSRADLCLGTKGLFYRHDDAADRDKFGALWARTVGRAGVGEPRFRDVSFSRQRQAMRDLLCQVCAGPASTTRLGTLFLLQGKVRSASELEDEPTGHPPLCLPCARLSRDQCPRLARRCTAVRARKPTVWGCSEYRTFRRHRYFRPWAASYRKAEPCTWGTAGPTSALFSPINSCASCDASRSSIWMQNFQQVRCDVRQPGRRAGWEQGFPRGEFGGEIERAEGRSGRVVEEPEDGRCDLGGGFRRELLLGDEGRRRGVELAA